MTYTHYKYIHAYINIYTIWLAFIRCQFHKQTANILKSIKRGKKPCCQMLATNTKKKKQMLASTPAHVRLAYLLALLQRFWLFTSGFNFFLTLAVTLFLSLHTALRWCSYSVFFCWLCLCVCVFVLKWVFVVAPRNNGNYSSQLVLYFYDFLFECAIVTRRWQRQQTCVAI